MGSLVYILSTRGDLCFSVHKLAKRSSNPSKVQFGVLVHLLRYIRDNKNLGLNYYSKIEDAFMSDILRQVSINTNNQLMIFSDSIWNYCIDTGRSTGTYILFYQGVTIDHCTHVPGTVAQYSTESECSAAFFSVMSLAHFMMINNKLFNKDTDVVPEQAPTIILDIN